MSTRENLRKRIVDAGKNVAEAKRQLRHEDERGALVYALQAIDQLGIIASAFVESMPKEEE